MLAPYFLRHARRRAGLTQRELATRAGVPQSYIARVESGRVDPSVSTLANLLRACEMQLGISPGSGESLDSTMLDRYIKMAPADRLHALHEEAGSLPTPPSEQS